MAAPRDDSDLSDLGIPTFVFRDRLREVDRPTDFSCLEVALLWGETLMAVRHLHRPLLVTVGDDPRSDFQIAADVLPAPRYALLEALGERGQVALLPPAGVGVEIADDNGGVRRPVGGVLLGLNERAAVQIGLLTLVAQYVSPARVRRRSLWHRIDYYFTKILSLSFVGHACLLLALVLTPLAPQEREEELGIDPVLIRLVWPDVETPPPVPRVEFRAGGPRAPRPEGRFGDLHAKRREATAGKRGARLVDSRKRADDERVANDAGLLRVLRETGASGSAVFGSELGGGIDAASRGLGAATPGLMQGVGGMGSRGTGPGGNGTTLGLPGLGGDGPGGSGWGPGDPSLAERGHKGPSRRPPEKRSCLSDAQVQRVLARLRSRARYCYERELPRDPNLEGKIITRFVIDSAGRVAQAEVIASTMKGRAVEACLLDVLERQRFPKCVGGVAEVTYPWIFKSTGR